MRYINRLIGRNVRDNSLFVVCIWESIVCFIISWSWSLHTCSAVYLSACFALLCGSKHSCSTIKLMLWLHLYCLDVADRLYSSRHYRWRQTWSATIRTAVHLFTAPWVSLINFRMALSLHCFSNSAHVACNNQREENKITFNFFLISCSNVVFIPSTRHTSRCRCGDYYRYIMTFLPSSACLIAIICVISLRFRRRSGNSSLFHWLQTLTLPNQT